MSKKPLQLDLLKNKLETRGRKRKIPLNSMGGVFHANYNPAIQRPMDSKKALHVVLKSSHAKGLKSFKHKNNEQKIYDIVSRAAKSSGLKIYDYANGGNHLHLLLKVNRREDYVKFIKSVTGLIARFVNKTERGKAKSFDLADTQTKYNAQFKTITNNLMSEIDINESQLSPTFKSKEARKKTKFWDARPFSRIVHFGKDFKKVKSYFFRNTLEALGWVKYQTRHAVKDHQWRSFWVDYCYSEIRI